MAMVHSSFVLPKNAKRKQKIPEPFSLDTANGVIDVDECVPVNVSKFGNVKVDAVLMDAKISALSCGEFCMEKGYSFHWPAYKTPYCITDTGEKIYFTVYDILTRPAPGATVLTRPFTSVC